MTRVLRAGDVIYLPRGWLHSATADSEVSAHLTVGVHVVTRFLLVEAMLATLANDPRLRASLPAGVDLADPARLAPHIETVLGVMREVFDEVDPSDVAAHVRTTVWNGGRPEPMPPVATTLFVRRLRAGDVVRPRSGLGHRLTRSDTGGARPAGTPGPAAHVTGVDGRRRAGTAHPGDVHRR